MEGRTKNAGVSASFVPRKMPPSEIGRTSAGVDDGAPLPADAARDGARPRGGRRARMSASTSSGSGRGDFSITLILVGVEIN